MTFSARPGQQLNITITDFSHQNNPNNQRSYVNYLELTESSGKREPVCAGSYGRTGHVMVTSGHDVTATFHIQDPRNQRFILTFEGNLYNYTLVMYLIMRLIMFCATLAA